MKIVESQYKSAILLLEDGTFFYGHAAGKIGTTTGEIAFNTGMTGYQEVFTDPSYYGQILIETNVHVGNYGVNDAEVESKDIKIAGLVTRNFTPQFSRKQSNGSIASYFEKFGIVAITGVDTRAIVRHVRAKGAMNCIISSENLDIDSLRAELAKVPSMVGLELSSKVSTKEAYVVGEAGKKVALYDLGVKENIIRSLTSRGCQVKVFPMGATYQEMKEWNPAGFMISNGPGDPGAMPTQVNTIKEIIANDNPTFGICLGHQLIAESQGISTYKMFNGHRGINHPVKNIISGHCEVTSQNHGFSINEEEVKNSDKVEITHINLNDNTIEGIRVKGKNAFSVQYHPESCPGPHDSRYLFDQFVNGLN